MNSIDCRPHRIFSARAFTLAKALLLTIGFCAGVSRVTFAEVTDYRAAVQAEPSLLSFYPFDGDTGSLATDRIPPAQNGTLSGATFSAAVGTVGTQSVQGARVALGTVPAYEFASGSGTIELFLYQTGSAAYNPCFFSGRDDSQSPAVRYSLHGDSAGGRLWIWNGSAAPNIATPINMVNQLVHVAYVFQADQVTIYFNGVALATLSEPLGAARGRTFQIGASGPSNQEAWPGRIDEVAIYGEALPASAIAAHYSAWGTAIAGPPPTITSQPQNQIVDPGQTATFQVQCADPTGLIYRWTRNGLDLPGATNATLAIGPVTVDDDGSGYQCVIYNAFGGVHSALATLSLRGTPFLLKPPVDAVRFAGQSVTFSVAAAGQAPLSYQWLRASLPTPGATNTSLTLASLAEADAGIYSVQVTNALGSTNSAAVTLTVLNIDSPQTVLAPPPFEWLPQDNGTLADAVLLFNEIQFHPPPGQANLQWIELQNVMRVDVDVSNWRLEGGVNFTFPAGTIVAGGAYLVVANDPAALAASAGLTNVFGPFTNDLASSGGHLLLLNHDSRLMDETHFGDSQPWPVGADGSGATLARRTPLSSSADSQNWVASPQLGGTPGYANSIDNFAVPSLAFNEIDAATSAVVRLEFHNYGASAVTLSDYALLALGANGLTNLSLPAAALPPGAFAVLSDTQFGYHPAQNDKLFLLASNETVLVDAATVKNRSLARAPDGIGRWLHPASATFGASNAVALNHDVVVNEIFYEGMPAYVSNIYSPSSEQWVELYNRGAHAVSIGGWRLDNGIRYTFPSNTSLAAGGFLVIAADAPAFAATHPGVSVLGNFSGKLAHSTELIDLKDADDNIVNEVRYFTGGRWPNYSGGGGSSLELIDPYADNRRAESWAASDESGHGVWQTVTYRSVATANKGYDVGDNIWNEFVLGLLDAGEFFLDDVSVVESPGTPQARQLIQNGDFQSDTLGSTPAGWRLLGNHGLHGHSLVELDPIDAGNKVLHVVSSGATDFLHNHLETTLKSGGALIAVTAGHEYEISYRARWIAGTRLVNTRLYANWLQRTSVLTLSGPSGTPGAHNSRRVASAGPTYTGFAHAPIVPTAGAPATVSVSAYDPQGIAAMTLFWRIDGGAWNAVAMAAGSGRAARTRYSGAIPGLPGGTKVQFYVQGRDPLGGTSTYPAAGPDSRALFTVNDGQGSAALNSNLRFVMTGADAATLYANTNRMSNERIGTTILYNESEVFYDVGVRLKGSAYGRDNDTETGLSIDFDPDHKFRGAHTSISIERGASKREILARFLFNQAGGGVAAGYDDVAFILTPRAQDAGACFLSTTRTTDTMLSTEYGGGGTVYNLELLYTPTTTVNGNPEAPKLNFPYVHTSGAPDIQDLGSDPEVYRWNFQIRNNRTRDDFSLMLAAAKSFELNGAVLDGAARDVLDIDQWLRCFAMESLVGNDDFYTRLYNHNFRMYQRPGDNRLVALPWDLDRAFNLAANASLWGNVPDAFGGTNRMRKIIEYPGNIRIYYGQLQDLISRCYNSAYATRWANHFSALLGDSGIATYPPYIGSRAAFVLSQIPAEPAFTLTTSNGAAFTSASNWVTLSGTAPYAVRAILVNGERFDPIWSSPTAWSIQLALGSGLNALSLQGVDALGRPLGNATASIAVTVSAALEDPIGKVVINEINYRPLQPEAEFIELFNSSATTAFDLAGWRLDGVGLTFPRSAVLAPRAFLVATANRLALATSYGAPGPAAEEFPGHIDGAGEILSLVRPGPPPGADIVVSRVRYEPAAPWPAAANGLGQSLQLVDAAQDIARVSNWNDGSGWRFFSYTSRIGSSRLSLFFDALGGDVFLDDLSLVEGPVASVGQNLLLDGDFESSLSSSWNFSGIATNSHRTNAITHSGGSCLHYIQLPGSPALTTFYQDIASSVVTNATYTLSGWYLVSGTNTNFVARAGSTFQAKPSLQATGPTPGLANFGTDALPPYPAVWLNEIQPLNLSGPTDLAGEHNPWVEIYNAGPSAVSLDGFALSDTYTNLARWTFPTDTRVAPGAFLVVWLDGDVSQNSATELHASFRVGATNGTLALSRPLNGREQMVDYLNYAQVAANESYGDVPDGQPFFRQAMSFPTPGAPNNGSSAPLHIFINEWMAQNSSFLADPADGKFDDWFELYNPGAAPADLGGTYLTDDLANKFQFQIPNNGRYIVPGHGYLLVWADNTPAQNSLDRPDLHVNFNLRAAGEAIGLFAADGTVIDAVTFGAQAANISEGRNPDGAATISSLPAPSPRGANAPGQTSPTLTGISLDPVGLTIRFSVVPGLRYRVQYKEDLGAATWLDLPGDVTAIGATATKGDIRTARQRFYRLQVVP